MALNYTFEAIDASIVQLEEAFSKASAAKRKHGGCGSDGDESVVSNVHANFCKKPRSRDTDNQSTAFSSDSLGEAAEEDGAPVLAAERKSPCTSSELSANLGVQ